jgi:hypothetical protein
MRHALRFVPEGEQAEDPRRGRITDDDCDEIPYAGERFDLGEAVAQSWRWPSIPSPPGRKPMRCADPACWARKSQPLCGTGGFEEGKGPDYASGGMPPAARGTPASLSCPRCAARNAPTRSVASLGADAAQGGGASAKARIAA